MATIVTRAGKGAPLTNTELDANFTNLNTDKLEINAALGTPASGVATNLTGTAAGLTAGNVTTNANLTGAITSTGNATLLGSFTSANLAAAVTDETGTGALVFATSPTLVTPALGTPASGVVTNLTGTASININGTVGAATPAAGAFTTLAASSPASFAAGTAALPAITRTGDTNTGLFFPAADTLAASTAGTERLRITSAGNVGIGTSSPSSKLHVSGGSLTLTPATSLPYEDVGNNPFIRRYIYNNGNMSVGQKIRLTNTTNITGRSSAMFFIKIHQNQLISDVDTNHAYAIFSFRVRIGASGGTPVIGGLTSIASFGWNPLNDFTFTGSAGGTFTLDFAQNTAFNLATMAIDMEMLGAGSGVGHTFTSTFTQSTI